MDSLSFNAASVCISDSASDWGAICPEMTADAFLSAGIMLATYWAIRYFAPAVASLWLAKQARQYWDSASAAAVMAASYAVSMAISYRLLAGATSTVRLHYPLFDGNVTIPRIVASWIRHNESLAKLLTKTVSLCYGFVVRIMQLTKSSYAFVAAGFWPMGVVLTGGSPPVVCLVGCQGALQPGRLLALVCSHLSFSPASTVTHSLVTSR